MSIDLAGLSISHRYGTNKIPSDGSVKNIDVTIQKWKKEFENVLADQSVCSSIQPDEFARSPNRNDLVKNQKNSFLKKDSFYSEKQNIESEQEVVFGKQLNFESMLTKQIEQISDSSKCLAGISLCQMDVKLGGEESSDLLVFRSGSERYVRQSTFLSERANNCVNMSVFIDHYKARVWFANNHKSSSESLDSIITKVRQTLRDKNVVLSSLVINGKDIYSENKIKD